MVATADLGVELAIRFFLIALVFVRGMSQSTTVDLDQITNGDTVCRNGKIIEYSCSISTTVAVASWIIGRNSTPIEISFIGGTSDTDRSVPAPEDPRIIAEQVSVSPLLVLSLRMPVDVIDSVNNVTCFHRPDDIAKSDQLISGDDCLPPNVTAVRVSSNVSIMVTFEPSPSRDVVGYNVTCSDSFCEPIMLGPNQLSVAVIHGDISADVNLTVMVTTINRCGCKSSSSPFTILLKPTAAPEPATVGRDAILAIVFGCTTLVAVLLIIPLIGVIVHYKNKSEENASEALVPKKDAKAPSQGDTKM